MTIRDVIWDSSDHTRAKLAILKGYLNAWFPILAQTRSKIVYIDGFAGPGVYASGEEGSPVVALRAAREHSQRDKFGEIVFWFIEQHKKRYKNLAKVLQEQFPDMKNEDGDRFQYHVVHGEFARSVESTLDEIESRNQNLAPTFAFIDPFGFSNMPMRTVRRILEYPHCEVMVTFMDGFIKRFGNMQKDLIDEIYGTSDWEKLLDASPSADIAHVDLYKRQLEKAGAKYVRTFQMKNAGGVAIYHMVYATKHIKGMEVMKKSMWSVSRAGEYAYSDRTDPKQQVLIDGRDETVWRPKAAKSVFEKFGGKRKPLDLVREHVVGHTPYPFQRSILSELEKDGKIVDVTGRKGKRGYPDTSFISFAPGA